MRPAASAGSPPVSSELAGFRYVFQDGQRAEWAVLLHGTGGDEHDLLTLGSVLAPGSALVSPRGRAPEGGGPGGPVNRWFARLAPGVLDEADIRRRAAEFSGFVPAAASAHGLRGRPWAVGYSNGANMAAAVMLLYPDLLAGAVLFRPMLPLAPETAPRLEGRPVYVAAGTVDTMIPRDSTEKLIALLQHNGADVTVRWADAGHRFTADEVEGARGWLAGRLAGRLAQSPAHR